MGTGRDGPTLTTVQALAIASQFGVTLTVAVGLGLFVGQWLDNQAHTGVVFTLIGVFLGLASAVSGVAVLYRAALRKGAPERRAETPVDEPASNQTDG